MEDQIPLFPAWCPPEPVITAAQRLANRILEGVRELEALLPEVELPIPKYRSSVRGARTVSIEFIQSMIAVTDGSEPLQAVGMFDTNDARAMLQFREAFRPVASRVIAFGNQINYSIEAWKARVARRALRMYVSFKYVAHPGLTEETSQLATLRRRLGRKNGAKKRRRRQK